MADLVLAKYVIIKLNNIKLSNTNKDRGLICDFAMEDIRKLNKRKQKISKYTSANSDQSKSDKPIKKAKAIPEENLDNVKDVGELTKLYFKCMSRGKKQRIRKS